MVLCRASPRCASATRIVRPLESISETQSQLKPVLLRLSAMITDCCCRACPPRRVSPCGWQRASAPRHSEAATKKAIEVNRTYLVIFNYGLKLAVSVMGPFIVIEAGLFMPE